MAEQLLQPGDRGPNFFLADQRDLVVSLYDKAKGGPILIVFLASPDADDDLALFDDLTGRAAALTDAGVHVFAVVAGSEPAVQALAKSNDAGFFVLADRAGKAGAAYAVAKGARATYVLDPNQRVLASAPLDVGGSVGEAAEAALAVPRPAAYAAQAHPPILIIPEVADRELCRYLIAQFWARGNEDSGTYRMVAGEPVLQTNYDAKRRRDHHVHDKDLLDLLGGVFKKRVIPEIKRAFQFQVTRVEEFKIVCYDPDVGGYFRAHRDNTSPQTMHRRFALTLCLNSEDYDGGALTFPEFGGATYTPPTGAAVVFSCDLLHQVSDVQRGRRFVVLSFLYDEAGHQQKLRFVEEMRKRQAASA